ncbi:MAG TPA: hypothetical protein VGE29_07335 [Prosthecobacter sp.]
MKDRFFKSLGLALVLGCLSLSPAAMAQEVKTPAKPSAGAEAQAKKLRADMIVPGVALAEGVSEITGVAISPLLGMSAIGAWKYYDTAPELRARLPWYCSPIAWGTGLVLVGLCFMKDFFGAAVPALVKKPLDFAELFEDKISALVASTAFVPLIALAMSHVERIQPQVAAAFDGSGLAMLPLASVISATLQTPWLTVPLSVFAFVVVWMSSHALNVLIALSPFGIVDACLKLTKLGLLSLVTGSAALIPYSPIPALVVCSVLILAGILLAGWSFRLSLFGTLMGRDVLLNKRAAKEELEAGVKGFLARRTLGVPVRTFGRLKSDETGAVHFVYRRWFVMPETRVAVVGEGMLLCKGVLHPSVAHRTGPDTRPRNALVLLPRYRRLEETIALRFGCQEVTDSTLLRGLKALRNWFHSTFAPSRESTQTA